MITSEQLARQMAVYSVLSKTKNVAALAQAIGLSPLQVTNAVFEGERLDLFTVVRDKKLTIEKIEVSTEQFDAIAMLPSNFGEGVANVAEHIVEFVKNRNSVERDVEETTAMMLARVPDAMFAVALEVAKQSGAIESYPVVDPLDKDSTYNYLTLPGNKDKKWYRVDFKTTKNKKKK